MSLPAKRVRKKPESYLSDQGQQIKKDAVVRKAKATKKKATVKYAGSRKGGMTMDDLASLFDGADFSSGAGMNYMDAPRPMRLDNATLGRVSSQAKKKETLLAKQKSTKTRKANATRKKKLKAAIVKKTQEVDNLQKAYLVLMVKEMKDRNSRYTRTKRLQRRNEGRPGWGGTNEAMAAALDDVTIVIPENIAMEMGFGFSRYKGPHGSGSWTDRSKSASSKKSSLARYWDSDGHAYLFEVVEHGGVVRGSKSSSRAKKTKTSSGTKKTKGK